MPYGGMHKTCMYPVQKSSHPVLNLLRTTHVPQMPTEALDIKIYRHEEGIDLDDLGFLAVFESSVQEHNVC